MSVVSIRPGQVYQFLGGMRETVLSTVCDDELLDPPFVVLRPEDTGKDHAMDLSEFVALDPELVDQH